MTSQSAAAGRDHYLQQPTEWLAGVSDIGQRHEHNQDALSLAARVLDDGEPNAVIAVSDGVSTSAHSDVGSMIAAQTACAHLISELEQVPQPDSATLEEMLTAAFILANDTITARMQPDHPESGSCTLLVGMVLGDQVSIANVGDCRAYWLGDDGHSVVLSLDDSMAQQQIELGVPREQAESSSQAHAITKWLGPNSPDATPRIHHFRIQGPGLLLACSDGLWNYASEAVDMQAVVDELGGPELSPSQLAESLEQWANAQGGRDNITVAVARLGTAR